MTTKPDFSNAILDTVTCFLDTAPELTDADARELQFSKTVTGEEPSVRMMNVTIDGDTYLVVVKRVGG